MSDAWKMVFDPFSGEFQLKRVPTSVVSGGGVAGTIVNGTLILPGGVQLEIADGMAVLNGSELLLEPGSQLLVLT